MFVSKYIFVISVMSLRWLATRCVVVTKAPASSLSTASAQYEFLDCGSGKKLERFGEITVSRRCPAAVDWKPLLPRSEWNQAQIRYSGSSGSAGTWEQSIQLPPSWHVAFRPSIQFSLELSEVGQVGIFPEQQTNWDWLSRTIKSGNQTNILNGFAYTGGSTMAALAAGPGKPQ